MSLFHARSSRAGRPWRTDEPATGSSQTEALLAGRIGQPEIVEVDAGGERRLVRLAPVADPVRARAEFLVADSRARSRPRRA